jgi:hypothetical protein
MMAKEKSLKRVMSTSGWTVGKNVTVETNLRMLVFTERRYSVSGSKC